MNNGFSKDRNEENCLLMLAEIWNLKKTEVGIGNISLSTMVLLATPHPVMVGCQGV